MNQIRLAAPLLGLGLILAACGGGAATTPPTTAPSAAPSVAPSAAPSEAPSEAPSDVASPAANGVSVNLADTSLGKVLVDGKGLTLYMFMADSAGKSACSGDCAANWPALIGATPTLGAGLDAGDFATITRDDGTTQISFYAQPLYTFAGDTAPGDTKGQGLGGKWYVLGADGKPIK